MIDFALTPVTKKHTYANGQIYYVTADDLAMDEAGNLLFVQNADCISQMIVTALKLFIGEYEFNEELGISWIVAMEYGYNQIPLIQYQIQQTIFALNDYINDSNLKIKKIQEFNYNFTEQRKLTINAVILLTNGVVLGINTNV